MLLVPPGAVHSQSVTGNQLLDNCSGSGIERTAYCLGYLSGVNEGLRLGVILPLLAEGGSTADELNAHANAYLLTCIPDNVTNQQNMDIVTRYLQDNPSTRHQPAHVLVIMAMREAFPCPAEAP